MRELRVSFPTPCGESWEAMTPTGRGRTCAGCNKVVHDLSRYDVEDAETLLRGEADVCVRARVGADGLVALKSDTRTAGRRMVLAAAVTAGLLAACEPALARGNRPPGAIVGQVESWGLAVRVRAIAANGETFRARVKRDGRYRIRHMPAGTYRLIFIPECGNTWTIENVVVGDRETVVPAAGNEASCIIVGMLRAEDSIG